MPDENEQASLRRRDLLSLIGVAGGGSALYMAMTSLGLANESPYRGPIKLEGDVKGASVLILGAGLAGLVAALELRNAGYKVRLLEYNDRPGGRNWTLRGGDVYTELGGAAQTCRFAKGLYFNPGPWRIPYHHHGMMDYCRRLGVALEAFTQVNHNAFVHSRAALGGKPLRFREVQADYYGHVAELLSKAVNRNQLDDALSAEDKEKLLQSLRDWGALNKDGVYVAGPASSGHRGWQKDPGGGLTAVPVPSEPVGLSDLLKGDFWRAMGAGMHYDMQSAIFQPVGGMDMIAKAFAKEVGSLIRYRAKVTAITQDDHGVTVTYEDLSAGAKIMTAQADWCLCTIPLSILSQIPLKVGPAMANAISAVPYEASVKVGLQFKRRFWEEDEAIYGGITYTDMPISLIAYPNMNYGAKGPGILLGAYMFGSRAYEFTAMNPAERIKAALAQGAEIHPQYKAEFQNGVAVAWHRVPWTLGCSGSWSEETRKAHYENLCRIDGRILLAGEHASYLPAWQEGALLSGLDAITRLHQRVMQH